MSLNPHLLTDDKLEMGTGIHQMTVVLHRIPRADGLGFKQFGLSARLETWVMT